MSDRIGIDGPYRPEDLCRDADNARLDEMGYRVYQYRAYRLEYVAALQSDNTRLQERVLQVKELMGISDGVAGLNIDGSIMPWERVIKLYLPSWADLPGKE